MINQVCVPVFELNSDGSIKPNPLFHRSWDKLHSRCIEYPFAASQMGLSKKILDVGTAKSDKVWIKWLDCLPIEVYATDFDKMDIEVRNIKFFQSDVRQLPFEDNSFDKIFAISVIEHIGLDSSQTVDRIPDISKNGDLEAISELNRILKAGGELIMTFPFSSVSSIYEKSARVYSYEFIQEIDKIMKQNRIEYYEYQHLKYEYIFDEFGNKKKVGNSRAFMDYIKHRISTRKSHYNELQDASFVPEHYGAVTWRRRPIELTNSTHIKHCDGIVCGIWVK